jgi:hypothetical protein
MAFAAFHDMTIQSENVQHGEGTRQVCNHTLAPSSEMRLRATAGAGLGFRRAKLSW